MRRFVLPVVAVAVVLLGSCASPEGCGWSPFDALVKELQQAGMASWMCLDDPEMALLVATCAFGLERGSWPDSLAGLQSWHETQYGQAARVRWDWYRDVTFRPSPDGGVALLYRVTAPEHGIDGYRQVVLPSPQEFAATIEQPDAPDKITFTVGEP